LQLLQGFYQPTNGTIAIDGIPLNNYDLQWLRQNMAIVSQEVVLFSTTIRQNIMFGNPNATESDMLEVARLTNVDRMVEKFPQVDIVLNVFC
jgi:ABC-type multidrug transport system fused ATPase/permease subunit